MAATLNETPLLALADALADAAWHSGEELAAAAGITRAALAKRVDRLREWGLDVEARQGTGYRLRRRLERLDAQRLRAAVPAALRLQVLAQTESTNALLLAAPAGDDPQACLAEHQTAGRGRRGRVWCSPFGANLYLSVAWSWPAWPRGLTTLPLAVGVVAARVLRQAGLPQPQLKWPNDLYCAGRKLGGVLIEQRGEAAGACRVVVGIGVNVAMTPAQAQHVEQAWISLDDALAAAGRAPASRHALAAALLDGLYRMLLTFPAQGFAPYAEDWAAFDCMRDRPVCITGAQAASGIARGVDADGALRLETADGVQCIYAGDVSLRPNNT